MANDKDIDRETIAYARAQLLNRLDEVNERLTEASLNAALPGGDDRSMRALNDEAGTIRLKLQGLSLGEKRVEQKEREALSAQRVEERRLDVLELRSLLEQHASALTELDEGLTRLLPVGDKIASLAADTARRAGRLLPDVEQGGLYAGTPCEFFLAAAGAIQAPDVSATLRKLSDFARRIVGDRDGVLQRLAEHVPETLDERDAA
jgi:hypothetical protein